MVPAYAPDAEYATRVSLGPCLFAASEESALADLAASAISAGVNRIGSALSEAAKEKTVASKATRNVEASARTFGPCVQVVRGWFYPDPFPVGPPQDALAGNKKLDAARGWLTDEFINEPKFRKLWIGSQLWLASEPEFFFEGRFVSSLSRESMAVAPLYVRLVEPSFTRTFRSDRSRHVAVFLSFNPPGSTTDALATPGATLILGKLTPGQARTYPAPEASDRFRPKVGVFNRWPQESEWFKLALGPDAEPWIVSAAVTETQDANEFLGFVAEVFGGAKESISTELQNWAIPERRAVVRESTKTALEVATTTFEQKQVAAIEALAICADASAPTLRQISEARAALRELNQAARAAKMLEPASQACIESIGLRALPAESSAACRRVGTELTSQNSCR